MATRQPGFSASVVMITMINMIIMVLEKLFYAGIVTKLSYLYSLDLLLYILKKISHTIAEHD